MLDFKSKLLTIADVLLVCIQAKKTIRGGRVAEMSAHSIQRCDWPTWRHAARSGNHSAESSGPTFRVLFLLLRSPCHI